MCEPSTRHQLIIALEPECAALYVRSQNDEDDAFKTPQYAVVDCGGGTVDIAYHSVENCKGSTFVVKELAPPSGGPYGGILVDQAFERLLEPVFAKRLHQTCCSTQVLDLPEPFFERLRYDHSASWLNLMKQLDEKKTLLKEKEGDEFLWFDMTMQFNTACTQITGKNSFSLLEHSHTRSVTLSSNDQMQVLADEVMKLYHPIIDDICRCLSGDLAKPALSKISALYMVGSFSQSSYLIESIRRRLISHVRPSLKYIINPPDCSVAIVKGAVMYGINPGIVQERVAAMSYGWRGFERFDSAKHPESKSVVYDGIKYCADIYDEFLKCGEKIRNTDEPKRSRHTPIKSNMRNMYFEVFSAPHTVRYVDDARCKRLVDLVVDMPDLSGDKNRVVHVEIEFDGPEIHVVATDENTGKKYDVSLEFKHN